MQTIHPHDVFSNRLDSADRDGRPALTGELKLRAGTRHEATTWDHDLQVAHLGEDLVAYERIRVQPKVWRAAKGRWGSEEHLEIPLHLVLGTRLMYSVDGGKWKVFYRGFKAEAIVDVLGKAGVYIVRPIKYGRVRDTTMTGPPRRFGNGTCRW